MQKNNLNGIWKGILPDGRELDVKVPGCWDTLIPEKNIGDKVCFHKNFVLDEYREGRYRLNFQAVSYYCDVWLNGVYLGSHEGMWDAFVMEAGHALRPGENEIKLEIWKPGYQETDRFPVRQVLSGFIPDVFCTFGGIWGNVSLEYAREWFADNGSMQGQMDGRAEFRIMIDGSTDENLDSIVQIFDEEGICEKEIHLALKNGENRCVFQMGRYKMWEPAHPYLYTWKIKICGQRQEEIQTGRLGFRTIESRNCHIFLNQKPVYPRGILHWGYYDEMIPRPDQKTISEEIEKVREYGFNMIKHCLYIPSEEYLKTADEEGMLLWIELPLWLPDSSSQLEARIRREFPRILEQIAGHPSVVLISLGCELDHVVSGSVLQDMYLYTKERLQVLVRDNSGSGECYGGLNIDYADFNDYHFYGELHQMENLMEAFTPVWKQNRPWMFGEFCDSDTLRDLKVLRKEANVSAFVWEKADPIQNPISVLKPDFFLGSHDQRMEESGIRERFETLRKLSYDHSMVHRKTTLEQTRSFPEISGYNITSIRDVPIATSGIFDDFMRRKFDSGKFRMFNQNLVLLPAWDLTRIWLNADRILCKERYNFFSNSEYALHILASNYTEADLNRSQVIWSLKDADGNQVQEGSNSGALIARGTVGELTYIYTRLPEVTEPKTYILEVKVTDGNLQAENQWPIFVYPKEDPIEERTAIYDTAGVFSHSEHLFPNSYTVKDEEEISECRILLTTRLTPAVLRFVEKGGKAVYVQRGLEGLPAVPVAFWREGIVEYENSPVIGNLRREHWMDDLRFFGIAAETAFSEISLPQFKNVRSLISRYDCREWRKDSYLKELSYGKGKILATTLRIEGGMGKQPLFLNNNTFGWWLLRNMIQGLIQGD